MELTVQRNREVANREGANSCKPIWASILESCSSLASSRIKFIGGQRVMIFTGRTPLARVQVRTEPNKYLFLC